MRISDIIAAYIEERLNEADGSAELQRNLLADEIGCVPSQINYVLSSRFTPAQGYLIESRRGGGGYIRITRVSRAANVSPLVQLTAALGDTLEAGQAQLLLERLAERNILSVKEARLLLAATSDKSFGDVPPEYRDRLRATMLKRLLTAISI